MTYRHSDDLIRPSAIPLKLIFVFVSVGCWVGAASDEGGKIIGGRFAKNGEFPATVAVEGGILCGGTLVSLKHVLSAARCFFVNDEKPVEAAKVKVTGGVVNIKLVSPDKQERILKEYKVHEKYNKTIRPMGGAPYRVYDIAMGLLEKPFIQKENLKPAVLPAADSAGMLKVLQKVKDENSTCQATGFGANDKKVMEYALKVAIVYIVPEANCRLTDTVDYEICTTTAFGSTDRTTDGDTGSTFLCGGYILGMTKGLNEQISFGKKYYWMIFTLIGPFVDYFKFASAKGETYRLHPALFVFMIFPFLSSKRWSIFFV